VGIARDEEPDRVVVESRFGDLRFPKSEVKSIEPGRTDLHDYREKLDEIDACPSPDQLFELSQWAQERGLIRYVNPLLNRTIELDPDHAEARRLLGFVQFEGNWMLARQRDNILAFRGSTHRTVAKPTVPVRRTTPKPEETPYSLGLPMLPNRSSEVYPTGGSRGGGGYYSSGGYTLTFRGVTMDGGVAIPLR
jgi:hypothetical protein